MLCLKPADERLHNQAVSNTSLLGADLSKGFLIGGDSAGANISVVLSHVARDDPIFEGRRFTGMYLCEPNICHYSAYPERCVYTPFYTRRRPLHEWSSPSPGQPEVEIPIVRGVLGHAHLVSSGT